MKVFKSSVGKYFSSSIGLGEFLIKLTQLSPEDVLDSALKGAVWIQRRGKGKILRIRNLDEVVLPADQIQVFFDKKILKLPTLKDVACLYEDVNYGAWVKPAGVLAQGTQAGDHTSLLRYVEINKKREVFLVHRIDRETSGLMLIAYHSKAAAELSHLFQKHLIKKEYHAIVLGEMEVGAKQTISASLDDKEAITHLEVLACLAGKSLIRAQIETGRLHQIRRHLDHIGHPVMGDPKYGKGNKNRDGLMLVSTGMTFKDPWLDKIQNLQLDNPLKL